MTQSVVSKRWQQSRAIINHAICSAGNRVHVSLLVVTNAGFFTHKA